MVFGRAPTGAKQKMVQPIVGTVSATIWHRRDLHGGVHRQKQDDEDREGATDELPRREAMQTPEEVAAVLRTGSVSEIWLSPV
jgi:hypothetical protein